MSKLISRAAGCLAAITLGIVVFNNMSDESSGNEPGISPGPPSRLQRVDYRVRLTWLTEPGQYGPGNYGRKLQIGGRQRYYEVHAAEGRQPDKPAPVVLVLHGGGGYATMMRYVAGMDPVSDREGFLVVYLAATSSQYTDRRLFWNAGHEPTDPRQARVDDVGYVSAVLDDLPKFFSVDTRRIYATGISNGAQMCYRLVDEIPERLAAIGAVASHRAVDEFARPPKRAVPIIHFHGKRDAFAPYQGGLRKARKIGAGGAFKPYRLQPVETMIKKWVKFNGCEPQPKTTRIGRTVRYHFANQTNGAEVVLWVLENGGHAWPGGNITPLNQRLGGGPVNRDVKASEEIWKFFKQHALPAAEDER